MFIKHAIITALTCWVLIFGGALGIAFYRNDVSAQSLLEYAWGMSAAVTALGAFARSGAATGTDVLRTEGTLHTSHNPAGYQQADNEDATAGFALGTIVMLSGLFAFVASLALLYAFFRQ